MEAVLPRYKVTRRSKNSLLVEMDGIQAGWEEKFLVCGDAHFDNPHVDRGLLKRHLDRAVAGGHGIMIIGDWLDVMQSRDDPRRSKDLLKPEFLVDYLDAVTDESIEFLRPYAEHIIFISEGNHESAVRRKMETNLTRRIARGIGCEHMLYTGFVQFRFRSHDRSRTLYNLYYTHGSGGGGEVTRGAPKAQRRAAMLTNVHIVVSAHIHEIWTMWIPQIGITDRGNPVRFDQLHASTGTYKDEMTGEGYHEERGRPPKPLGAIYVKFLHDMHAWGRIRYDVERA